MNTGIGCDWGRGYFRAFILTLCALAGLSGCGPEAMSVKSVADVARPPKQIAPDVKLAPIALAKVVVDIPRGTRIGSYRYVPLHCYLYTSYVFWNRGRMEVNPDEFVERFYRSLKAANYNVSGDPSVLFTSSVQPVALRYRVGARIDHIAMNLCHLSSTNSSQSLKSGEASIRITWQVQDAVDERVVYQTATEGGAEIAPHNAATNTEIALIVDAFESAARNLAADSGFYKLVSTAAPPTVEPPAGKELHFRPAPAFHGPITAQMDPVRLGVVTLSTAGQHGSGFFISPTLILTNSHVVKGHDIVRVTLVTGRKLLGEVIRSHARRDVALVSVEAGGHSPLPLRMDPPLKIGEDVYAIGTPLDRSLSGTVTKGIVSAFRSNEAGLEDIQADVRINPGNSGGPLLDASGNVVGITYATIRETATGGATGLNLFIPIRDALDKLGLAADDPTTGRPAAER